LLDPLMVIPILLTTKGHPLITDTKPVI